MLKKLKPNVLAIEVCPQSKKLGREYVPSLDVLK
jgi:hypothetical protein